MMQEVMTIWDFGLMKLGRLAEREAFCVHFRKMNDNWKGRWVLMKRCKYRIKYARNAVGFGEESAVDDWESRPDA